jgi:hypothetical protein
LYEAPQNFMVLSLAQIAPPKKGPNSQVPPVKLKGGGCAIRGTKFKGVF